MENTINLSTLTDSQLNKLQLKLNKEKSKRKEEKIEQLDTEKNKRKEWKENYSHLSWEEFDSDYYLCTMCLCYVNESCICYAR